MMFNGGIVVGEVFKHHSRDIWVQVTEILHGTPPPDPDCYYVFFDPLIGDSERINNGEAGTVLSMREFCLLFDPSAV
jgi:hypothetical protein